VVLIVGDCGRSLDVIGPASVFFCGDGAEGEPRGDGAGFAAGVAELDGDFLALGMGELNDAVQWLISIRYQLTLRKGNWGKEKIERREEGETNLDLSIFPQPRILRCDSSLRHHSCSLHHCESRTSRHNAPQMSHMPSGMFAIICTVLTQRAQHDPILERHAADGEGREELWDGVSRWLRIGGSAGRRDLCGCEVGDPFRRDIGD
jgi:hypothetical protein